MQTVAKFNPVNWAVVAARAAAMQRTDWGVVGTRVALLAGLAIVAGYRGLTRLRPLPAVRSERGYAPSARAMTISWISSVPSPIVRILASR